MRLVDGDVLARELLSLTWLVCDGGYCKGMADERDATLQRIANLPEIEPVKRGKWREAYEFDAEIGKELLCGFECSICYCDSSKKTNFCPNCGAKMESE